MGTGVYYLFCHGIGLLKWKLFDERVFSQIGSLPLIVKHLGATGVINWHYMNLMKVISRLDMDLKSVRVGQMFHDT